ncbi:MAG: hypothetical protein JJU29_09370 [Verrucomicrobia bacterium]|nr:hypothetical protein [Verrucomicrobiota bacterium]MCH8511719.1 hypothetical protein [Kiritimatiellia bacterium]
MKTPKTNKRAISANGLALLTILLVSSAVPAQADWFVEAGPFYRGGVKISVDGGSRAAGSGINVATPGSRGAASMAPGALLTDDGSAAVFRQFDDGYVGPSGWVWAQEAGVTQFFAYETPGQYDAGASTLTFTRSLTATSGSSTRTTTQVTDSGPSGWNDSTKTNGFGVMAAVGYHLRQRTTEEDLERGEEERNHELSLLFRVGWLEGLGANFRNRSAFGQNVSTRSVTSSVTSSEVQQFTYDTFGNPFFPTAPYTMSDPSGVGPMISDTPDSVNTLSRTDSPQSSTRTSGFQTQSLVDLELDVEAFTFQFGPRWVWGEKEGVSLFVQPLATLNLIDASATRNEYYRDSNGRQIATWRDDADDQSWRWGAGIQVGLQACLSENWYLNGSGGYEWVKSTHLNVGPDRVRIDLSGYQFELAIGRRF